jgi:protoporphyrinogen oxidase
VEKEITTNPGSGKSPVQVRTSTKVVAVTRGGTGGGVQVSSTASGAGSSVTENFDRIIVTSPLQTAASFMQLTPQETKWFSQIKTVRYLVTLAEPPVSGRNSPAGAFFTQNMVPSRANHAVALGVQNRQFGAATQRSLRTFYQILDDAITTAAATEILKQDALELTGVPLGEIKAQRNWEGDSAYFPHLSSVRMRSERERRERERLTRE